MAESHDHSPLSHVVDHNTLEVPFTGREIELGYIPFTGIRITRFMVMELIVAALILLIILPLVRHIVRNRVTRGRFMNLFEAVLIFIRDKIARPAIDGDAPEHGPAHDTGEALAIQVNEPDELHGGSFTKEGHSSMAAGHEVHHDHGHHHGHNHGRLSEKFLPFLWTLFFFILFCNLLGMLPGGASATSSINVTGAMALLTFLVVLYAGMSQQGVVGFWKGIVPKLDVPPLLKPILWPLMFVIEVMGLLIKHFVLSVRLFANMLAGHLVLAVILGFIALAPGLWSLLVTPVSIVGVVCLSFLELFVAVLQAYIFTFLAALFIGSVCHAH